MAEDGGIPRKGGFLATAGSRRGGSVLAAVVIKGCPV